MLRVNVYLQNEFPEMLKWQAISFMRVEWSSIFRGAGRLLKEPYSPECAPVHFAVTEEDVLLSYATILREEIMLDNQPYAVYGFGNLFTFPPYRGEGLGQQVLVAATRYIHASDVDIAILYCDPKLAAFYAKAGWVTIDMPTRIGAPAEYEEYATCRMMLFVSERGKAHRPGFEQQPLYVKWTW